MVQNPRNPLSLRFKLHFNGVCMFFNDDVVENEASVEWTFKVSGIPINEYIIQDHFWLSF